MVFFPLTAILYGSVAASFAIEQSGLPLISKRASDGSEAWGPKQETGWERLARFRQTVETKKAGLST